MKVDEGELIIVQVAEVVERKVEAAGRETRERVEGKVVRDGHVSLMPEENSGPGLSCTKSWASSRAKGDPVPDGESGGCAHPDCAPYPIRLQTGE